MIVETYYISASISPIKTPVVSSLVPSPPPSLKQASSLPYKPSPLILKVEVCLSCVHLLGTAALLLILRSDPRQPATQTPLPPRPQAPKPSHDIILRSLYLDHVDLPLLLNLRLGGDVSQTGAEGTTVEHERTLDGATTLLHGLQTLHVEHCGGLEDYRY